MLVYCNLRNYLEEEEKFFPHLHQPKSIICFSVFVIAPPAVLQCLSCPAGSGDEGSNESWMNSFLFSHVIDGGFVLVYFIQIPLCHGVGCPHTLTKESKWSHEYGLCAAITLSVFWCSYTVDMSIFVTIDGWIHVHLSIPTYPAGLFAMRHR